MTGLYQRFLLLLAAATDRELATHVQYLKEENRILRSKLPDRITVTPQERQRLVRFGLAVGNAIKDLITIVSPRTVLRWVNGDSPRTAASPRKPGRPRTAEAIRDLVLRLARETGWGYTRILGELKKLGIRSVSRTTVVNILREAGLDPGPKRGEGTRSEFLTRHAQTLWACDFFSTKVWTTAGLVEMYVLVFLHLGGRRLVITGMTLNPDAAWMAQQARNFCLQADIVGHKPAFLLRDHDTKFTAGFDAVLRDDGITVKPVGPLAPNLNAHCERVIQTIKHECLDHFVVFGEAHLRHLLSEFLVHYHRERPHQGIGNVPPSGALPVVDQPSTSEVVCDTRLGGLLKHYRRAA